MTKINQAGRIEELSYGEFFNVQLHNGDNPAIELKVDFAGMPVKTLTKLAYDTMKVKFRPHVKAMKTEDFLKTFNHQTITWREMITKSGSASKIAIAEKSPEEIAGEIARLQALLSTPVSKGDEDVDEDSDDINSENYTPKTTKTNN